MHKITNTQVIITELIVAEAAHAEAITQTDQIHPSQPGRADVVVSASGGKISVLDLNSVGMQRPVAKRLGLAEPCLGQLRGLALVCGIDFQTALANFRLPTVGAEHVLHEPNDIS